MSCLDLLIFNRRRLIIHYQSLHLSEVFAATSLQRTKLLELQRHWIKNGSKSQLLSITMPTTPTIFLRSGKRYI